MKENNSNYTNRNGQNISSQKMDLIAEAIMIPINYLPRILGSESPTQQRPVYPQQQQPAYSNQGYSQNTPTSQPNSFQEQPQKPGPRWERFGNLAERMAAKAEQAKAENPPQSYSDDPFPQNAPFPPSANGDMPF